MSDALQLTNQRSGRLTALEHVGRQRRGNLWLCACSCGGTIIIPAAAFARARSCGCRRASLLRKGRIKLCWLRRRLRPRAFFRFLAWRTHLPLISELPIAVYEYAPTAKGQP